jgi:SAM-dependent methyltransferase
MSWRDSFYYLVGIGFLALAKAANILRGYSTPKPFDNSDLARCVDYDLRVVDAWLSHLRAYAPGADALAGKNVLELGPGSDLGIGIYLLAQGCAQYNACDVHDLVKSTPDGLYERLFARISTLVPAAELDVLRGQLKLAQAGTPSRLNYRVSERFDVAAATLGASPVDLVFSQAAFEHFDDVGATISQLGAVCRPGAILVAEIDLKTHTRWIRDQDPNNIYRYSRRVYRLFHFRGSPNRVRPYQYKEMLEMHRWTNVVIVPRVKLPNPEISQSGLNAAFVDPRNQMDYLSVVVCATKK